MDPDVTLLDYIDAVEAGEMDRAEDLHEVLMAWLRAGGFPPRMLHDEVEERMDEKP